MAIMSKTGLIFKDTGEAELRFLEIVTQIGNNLSDDIQIGNNSIILNSSKTGLNKSANLTFYGTNDLGFSDKTPYRNGAICPSSICTELQDLPGPDIYIFNVTSFTNYSVGEAADTTPPIVYLESPQNNTINTTDNTPDFSFNVTDETATTLDCVLWLDNGTVKAYGQNSSVQNATSTIITANESLSNDDYLWWINCSDGINTNISEKWNISVDVGLRCGDTITSSITLKENLKNSTDGDICPEHGLIIGADNIVLDCAEYSINGDGVGTDYGINNTGYDNVTVKNCNITNFYTGIYFVYSNNSKIINNTVKNNSYRGIWFNSSSNNNFTLNTIKNNDEAGIFFNYGSNNNFTLNIIKDNNADGIWFNYGSNNILDFNTLEMNNHDGIRFNDCSNNTLISNIVQNSTNGKGISF